MSFLYNIVIRCSYFILQIIALFNNKMHLFVKGRKQVFNQLKNIKKNDNVVWIHAASLGEFEQGRPIIEALKKNNPNYTILLTFFSPSGYEIRKNYPHADVICYLPFDTKSNMKKFIKMANPKLAVIIKYEFWPNLLDELKTSKIKTILVSGIFRENQSFFKWYGGFMRNKLKTFDHFFVQNELSKKLLNTIHIENVTLSGDTRFDRVFDILKQNNSLAFLDTFKNNKFTIVAGSTWKEDEELLIEYINNHATKDEKFIIAPHTIEKKKINELASSIKVPTTLFSKKENVALEKQQVLIIDTIGLLTKIYSYADVAYIGGGLATGLHNILEAATYGIPIVFGGNKYHKFKEANDLLIEKSVTKVTNKEELIDSFVVLKSNSNLRNIMGTTNFQYVKKNIGATNKILEAIKNYL